LLFDPPTMARAQTPKAAQGAVAVAPTVTSPAFSAAMPPPVPVAPAASVREERRTAAPRVTEGMRQSSAQPRQVPDETRMAARLERAKAITFKQCAHDYVMAHSGAWKNAGSSHIEWREEKGFIVRSSRGVKL